MNDVRSIAQMAEYLQTPAQGAPEDSENGLKRKAGDDGSQAQQRSRRNRYVSIACNECKRRKIKCNGETPCQRCGNLNLSCEYQSNNCCPNFKDSQEYRDMSNQIAALQDQVNALYEGVNQLRANMSSGMPLQQQQQQRRTPIDPSLHSTYPTISSSYQTAHTSPNTHSAPVSPNVSRMKSQALSDQSAFRGPASSDFSLEVAKSNQYQQDVKGGGETGTADASSERMPPRSNSQLTQTIHEEKDIIWRISQVEALRLCRVYEDEFLAIYPVLDINRVTAYATRLYRFMEAGIRAGLIQTGLRGSDAIDDTDSNILKLLLATSLTVEGSGRSELGMRLFAYVQPAIDNMLLGSVGVNGVRLLTMTAMYEFHRDNESTSWRIIGLAARLCIELGLHKHQTYEAIQDESERVETMLLFWSIYTLDRRWSFGTGMPFALQESDIDPLLPKPEDHSPYLSAMIQYATIGGKVWRSTSNMSSAAGSPQINVDDLNYLEYQILQWYRNLPAGLKYDHPSQAGRPSSYSSQSQSRAALRSRILLYLRANQMRILIFRPVLQSSTSIMQHRDQAQNVVDVAKDSVRILTHTNQTSDLYRTQQVLFNAFLTSALAVLFLAVSHMPALFVDNVREEFSMALDLIRGFSKESWISKRLWGTIRVLKDIGPKIGLARKYSEVEQLETRASEDELVSSRSAAVAMAGLAGHSVDPPAQQWSSGGNSSSPENMVHDLNNLFEAAGGYQNMASAHGQDGLYASTEEWMSEGFGADDDLSNILGGLF